MAGKPKPMSQIKQLLRLHEQGHSIKSIARNLGISKNTVKSYIIKLSTGLVPLRELLTLEDPVLESRFHVGNPAYKDPRFTHLSVHLDYFIAELKRVGVTKKLLWEEYKASQPAWLRLLTVLLSFTPAVRCPQAGNEARTSSCR